MIKNRFASVKRKQNAGQKDLSGTSVNRHFRIILWCCSLWYLALPCLDWGNQYFNFGFSYSTSRNLYCCLLLLVSHQYLYH
jgi:hypothetical protein